MTLLIITLTLLVALLVAASIGRYLKEHRPKPCYRCGLVAKSEYMALHYCRICREVVVRMLPVVGMGGMYGFPGSPGYLEFPTEEEQKKKEDASHG